MNTSLFKINITDNASLLEACDVLHDALFESSSLELDMDRGVWKARFEREPFEDPGLMTHERKLFFFVKSTFPIVQTELTITGLKSYRVEGYGKSEVFFFYECRIDGKIATLLFSGNMKMILEFEDMPRGLLFDLRLLDKTGTMWTSGPLE